MNREALFRYGGKLRSDRIRNLTEKPKGRESAELACSGKGGRTVNHRMPSSGRRPDARRHPKKKRRPGGSSIPYLLLTLAVLLIALTGIILVMNRRNSTVPLPETDAPDGTKAGTADVTGNNVPQTGEETRGGEETNGPLTYREVTILSAGDIMFHLPQVNSAYRPASGTYDFTDTFQYVAPFVRAADYAVVNFETTLSGTSVPYSGFPAFNSPDSSLDAVKGAGFNMVLFANNHAYDHRLSGLQRTVSMFEQYGLDYIGARQTTEGRSYRIADVNGVKVGFLNYADDLGSDTVNRTINGIPISANDLQYIDLYNNGLLDQFYESAEARISEMREQGAELIVFYIHWGVEYYTQPSANQKAVAQKLCDLGVDAIIGSHPHVVQPAEPLVSGRDPSHRTICFYSLGNYVSNQCRQTLSAEYCHGNNVNTENGLMVQLRIRKYSDGSCMIAGVETIPTWVHRYMESDGYWDYRIIPLAAALEQPDEYGLNRSSTDVPYAKEAMKMTDELISSAVEAFNRSLDLPAAVKAD